MNGYAQGLLCFATLFLPAASLEADDRRPNFVLIFADDLGYGDLGCYGAEKIRTPRLDKMAEEGMRLTSFYAQPICGPSRAAIMTGCYPMRVAQRGNKKHIHPELHTSEITIAELLKDRGYATACYGKWDLAGHRNDSYVPELLPRQQGFDTHFGPPTSNDSVKQTPLLRDGKVIERPTDFAKLTERYTDEAIRFIEAHREEPFFVYVPHTMPHTVLAASKKFRGKSKQGLYGDVIEELDHNVGRIVDKLRELGLADNTYVIFTSDNGPWLVRKAHGGSAGRLRAGKVSTWEGGQRVPCIVWAPGRVPAGKVCDEITSTLDVLPTLAKLAGTKAPLDRKIDGHDVSAILHGAPGAKSPTEAYFYYLHTHLQAIRSGKWKLHVPRPARPKWLGGLVRMNHFDAKDYIKIEKPLLFDLEADLGERIDVADKNPEVVARLLKLIEQARADIGDYNRKGKGQRLVPSAGKSGAVKESNGRGPARANNRR